MVDAMDVVMVGRRVLHSWGVILRRISAQMLDVPDQCRLLLLLMWVSILGSRVMSLLMLVLVRVLLGMLMRMLRVGLRLRLRLMVRLKLMMMML